MVIKLAKASGADHIPTIVKDAGDLKGEGHCWFVMLGKRSGSPQQFKLCEYLDGKVNCCGCGDQEKIYGIIDTMLHYYGAPTDWHSPNQSKYMDEVEDLKDGTGRPAPLTERLGPRTITRQ